MCAWPGRWWGWPPQQPGAAQTTAGQRPQSLALTPPALGWTQPHSGHCPQSPGVTTLSSVLQKGGPTKSEVQGQPAELRRTLSPRPEPGCERLSRGRARWSWEGENTPGQSAPMGGSGPPGREAVGTSWEGKTWPNKHLGAHSPGQPPPRWRSPQKPLGQPITGAWQAEASFHWVPEVLGSGACALKLTEGVVGLLGTLHTHCV